MRAKYRVIRLAPALYCLGEMLYDDNGQPEGFKRTPFVAASRMALIEEVFKHMKAFDDPELEASEIVEL